MGCFVGQRKLAVKISDFGLVKLVGEEWVRSQAQLSVQCSLSMGERATRGGQDSEGTSTRSLLGTYAYMSPEQKRCEEADARSDLYSVGLMAFKLLPGRNPGTKPPLALIRGLCRPGTNLSSRPWKKTARSVCRHKTAGSGGGGVGGW